MIVIGVDPGLSGAIAAIGPSGAFVVDMPTAPHGPRRAVDLPLVARWVARLSEKPAVAVIEDVHAFPGQGVSSMFSLGMSFWGVAGVFAGLGIPVELVKPRVWKAHYWLDQDKSKSLVIARKMFPRVDLRLAKHHNRAEALLIAAHGMESK